MTTTVDILDAQTRLSSLLKLARAGNEIIIAEKSRPVARLVSLDPVPDSGKARVAGLHQGAASVSADFDGPLPDEFWLGSA